MWSSLGKKKENKQNINWGKQIKDKILMNNSSKVYQNRPLACFLLIDLIYYILIYLFKKLRELKKLYNIQYFHQIWQAEQPN